MKPPLNKSIAKPEDIVFQTDEHIHGTAICGVCDGVQVYVRTVGDHFARLKNHLFDSCTCGKEFMPHNVEIPPPNTVSLPVPEEHILDLGDQ